MTFNENKKIKSTNVKLVKNNGADKTKTKSNPNR